MHAMEKCGLGSATPGQVRDELLEQLCLETGLIIIVEGGVFCSSFTMFGNGELAG